MSNGRLATLLFASLACTGLLGIPDLVEAKTTKSDPAQRVAAKHPASTTAVQAVTHNPPARAGGKAAKRTVSGKTGTLKLAQAGGKSGRHAARNSYICNYPVDASGITQHGIAVYYGANMRRVRQTALGERFDPHGLTAASPNLPLGSQADVTNLRTGRTLRVRINDRGPYGPGLMLDLTPAAADQLGMLGSGRDQVEIQPVKETLN